MASSAQNERFRLSHEWARRGELCEAWSATRRDIRREDRFVEGAYPVYASRASGAHLWDVDGNRYLDYILGYGTVIIGHADSRVMNAVVNELKKGVCLSPLWRPLQVELAELVTAIVPRAEMAYFMRTGSDATSGALRLARIYTGRDKVIKWGYNGWHDWTAWPTAGVPPSARSETLTFTYNDISSVRALFAQYPDQISCVIMMPFELEAPLPGFLNEVREIAHENGALFILDEMRSGFRMSLGGAQQYFDIQADVVTLSKAMSNGYPISAIVGREDVLRCLGRTHMASTFYANSAEMAAAVTTISILKESNAIQHIWKIGERFKTGLASLINEYSIEAEVVGFPPCPFLRFTASEENVREAAKSSFYAYATENGILFHPNHHWFISSVHTVEDIEFTLEVCRGALQAVRDQR